jgi:hypothetical protein
MLTGCLAALTRMQPVRYPNVSVLTLPCVICLPSDVYGRALPTPQPAQGC